MLTAEIKQKIDNARNILVGKIPTPTGQVEQITLALVYKFMHDIDEQNKELGGQLKFFTGEYSKYAWKHLMDKSLSAYERVTAYGEGLEKMHLNPNLPQFFRNVFRGAFLPFRDPEVLTIFLKQIDEFKYGHNGDLGDAFEYLLQVMGTQGDAGQFLTPRHIINFIVDIVDPQKTDKTLDPAEGTAGFLISTFLHILKNNTKPGSNLPGSALTYDERKKLSDNLVGYDISHDMVRLSLVNLYLHGFADPKIYEYDTLGNLDRWDDDFDCIETNPPFMTPKGGVKPHKRFSIQAKKSEVLFVDYIMEHLNPNGKAGIIVPEGIIFQSATAYKALRKMMIDQNFLYAVVSLPAGIFNPYSGVKTSVLFMDRVLAKKTKDILFVKIENDGFDLGAQRRPIDKNDIPQATEILKRYKTSIQTGKQFELSDEDKKIASLVPIEKISKSGDYNLSGDRYKETVSLVNQKWPLVELKEVTKVGSGDGAPQDNEYFINGKVFFFRTSDIGQVHICKNLIMSRDKINQKAIDELKLKIWPEKTILFPKSGASTFLNHRVMLGVDGCVSSHLATIQSANDKIIPDYLFYLLCFVDAKNLTEDQNYPSLRLTDIERIKIPLPPLEVQQEIVSQLDSYQKIIDGAKQVVDNYKPEIKIDLSWEMVELGNLIDFVSGLTLAIPDYIDENGVPIISISNVSEEGEIITNNIRKIKLPNKNTINFLRKGDLLFNWRNGSKHLVGKTAFFDLKGDYVFASFLLGIRTHMSELDNRYLWILLNHYRKDGMYLQFMRENVNGLFNREELKIMKIPLPPLNVQKQIASRIEEEQQIVNANKKLIELYQGKIKEKIDEVWGK